MCASPSACTHATSIDVLSGKFTAAPEGARTHAHQSTRPLAFVHRQTASVTPLYQRGPQRMVMLWLRELNKTSMKLY